MKKRLSAAARLPLFLFLMASFGISNSAQALSSSRIDQPIDIQPAAPQRAPWGANTSGPFYTGTADVEPGGSFYVEPYLFDNREHASESDQFVQKMALGMGHHMEFDLLIPLEENSVPAAYSPTGKKVSDFEPGDSLLTFKYQLTPDADTYRFWAKPTITVTADFLLPSGNVHDLRPQLSGTDQSGNGTFEEGVGVLVRKRFKPFVAYGQLGETVASPATVSAGYEYDNNIGVVPPGMNEVRMVDGNQFAYSGALEDVFNTKHGIGAILEATGAVQSGQNPFFGKATAPTFSYLSMAPELEFTWPAGKRFAMTWGGGVTIPVARNNYARTVTPMVTVSFYFNGPNGSRSSD